MQTLSESILMNIKEGTKEDNRQYDELMNKIFGPLKSQGVEARNNSLVFSGLFLELWVYPSEGEITIVEPERNNPQAIVKTTNGVITYLARESHAPSFTYSLKVDESKREIKDSDKLYGHTLAEIKQQPDIFNYIEEIYEEYTTNKYNDWKDKEVKPGKPKEMNNTNDFRIVVKDLLRQGYTIDSYLDMLNKSLKLSYSVVPDGKLTNESFSNVLHNFRCLFRYGHLLTEQDVKINNKLIKTYFNKDQYTTGYDDDQLRINSLCCSGQRVSGKYLTYLTKYIEANPGMKEFPREFVENLFSLVDK